MSNTTNRFALLGRQPHPIFHNADLARLWNIRNKNTLYTLLKRYAQKGLLFRIYKGLYSLHPPEKLDPVLLGIKALHSYAYVSTETILVREGIMMQTVYQVTLISAYSRRFTIGTHDFRSRKLQNQFLYNTAGILEKNGIFEATLERAVADLLHFNPSAYLDGIQRVDFKKLNQLQKEIGYKITFK